MLSINSTEFSISRQPDGLRELTHRVYFSDDLGGYLEEFSGDLTFTDEDYTYLRRRFFTDGCAVVPVTLTDSCGLSLNGNLFLNEAEWRPDICSVSVQVVDAGFLSLIDNNKGIKFYLNVPRSKNDVDISAFTVVQTDLEFKPANLTGSGSTPAINRSGVRVYDALKYLCAAMSDGLIEFESDYFNPINDPDSPRIPTLITADEVRNGRGADALFPYISFEELFKDIRALYNVGFVIINGVMRVEPIGYFAQTLVAQTFDHPDEVRQSADEKSFYANVKFGYTSDSVKDYDYYPNATFAGFSKEQYHLGGQCNTKNDLDLQLKAIIADPNVIMLSLPQSAGGENNADYSEDEEDIYIVVFDANNETVQYGHPTDANAIYYNKPLQNLEVAQRWGNGIPFPIFLFLGAGANGSQAQTVGVVQANDKTCESISWWVSTAKFNSTSFPNGYDPNNNMQSSNVNFGGCIYSPNAGVVGTTYTSPVSAVYTVAVDFVTSWVSGANIIVVDASDNILDTIPLSSSLIGTFALSVVDSKQVFVSSGDRIAIKLNQFSAPTPIGGIGGGFDPNPPSRPVIYDGGSFTVYDPFTFTQTYDPNDNLLIETSFEYPIAPQTWRNFLNQRFGTFTVTHPNGRVKGFLKEANRNLHTGKTDWVLRSTFGNS